MITAATRFTSRRPTSTDPPDPLAEQLRILGLYVIAERYGELAEAAALADEWQSAETLARIADEELTQIQGFEDFRRRVLMQR